MIKKSLHKKLIYPLVIGTFLISSVMIWVAYQSLLDELRVELRQRAHTLTTAVSESVQVIDDNEKIRFALEEITRKTSGVYGITYASSEPFIIWASSFHPGANNDQYTQDMLSRLTSSIEQTEYGFFKEENEDLVYVWPISDDKGQLITVASNISSDIKPGSILYLRFDWAHIRQSAQGAIYKWFLTIIIGIALLAILFWLLIYRIVVLPIRNIQTAISLQKNGVVDGRVVVTTNDEIGQLGKSLSETIDALNTRDQLVRSIVENMPAALVLKNKDLSNIMNNRLYSSYFDSIPNNRADKRTEQHNFFTKREEAELAVLQDGATRTLEEEVDNSDGEKRHYLTCVFPINGDGERLEWLGLLSIDITDKKYAEEEHIELQRKSFQTQKMEALGRLTGGIAHDFNNILAIVAGHAELAMNNAKSQSNIVQTKHLEKVMSATSRASKTVEQLLAYSRDQGLSNKIQQLAPLIHDNLELLRDILPASITIKTELMDNIPNIAIDDSQFTQAMLNLCINARDAMDGSGLLLVRLEKKTDVKLTCISCGDHIKGEWVILTISDTGHGIDPKIIKNIFNPFFTTKGVGEGAGMGMSVVHGIAHSSGGHISVESEPQRGATFKLFFPPTEIYTENTATQDSPVVSAQKKINVQHILIVDDEPEILSYLQDLLSSVGYKTTALEDSQEAITLFNASPDQYDLVITDQTMPNITGDILSSQLRTIKPSIPIILITGHSELIDTKKASELNLEYIKKPIDSSILFKKLSEKIS